MAGSSSNHIFTVDSGTPVIDTAQYKFGGSSLRIAGAEGIISDDGFQLPSGGNDTHTVEFWVRMNAQPTGGIGNPGESFIGMNGNTTDHWMVGLYTQFGLRLLLHWQDFGNGNSPQTNNTSLPTGEWVHLAYVKRSSTNGQFYRNGTLLSEVQDTAFTGAFPTPPNGLIIGDQNISSMAPLDYWMDELRISEVARYTTNFTVETERFTADPDTSLLMHFDEVDDSTVFKDEHIVDEGFPKSISVLQG